MFKDIYVNGGSSMENAVQSSNEAFRDQFGREHLVPPGLDAIRTNHRFVMRIEKATCIRPAKRICLEREKINVANIEPADLAMERQMRGEETRNEHIRARLIGNDARASASTRPVSPVGAQQVGAIANIFNFTKAPPMDGFAMEASQKRTGQKSFRNTSIIDELWHASEGAYAKRLGCAADRYEEDNSLVNIRSDYMPSPTGVANDLVSYIPTGGSVENSVVNAYSKKNLIRQHIFHRPSGPWEHWGPQMDFPSYAVPAGEICRSEAESIARTSGMCYKPWCEACDIMKCSFTCQHVNWMKKDNESKPERARTILYNIVTRSSGINNVAPKGDADPAWSDLEMTPGCTIKNCSRCSDISQYFTCQVISRWERAVQVGILPSQGRHLEEVIGIAPSRRSPGISCLECDLAGKQFEAEVKRSMTIQDWIRFWRLQDSRRTTIDLPFRSVWRRFLEKDQAAEDVSSEPVLAINAEIAKAEPWKENLFLRERSFSEECKELVSEIQVVEEWLRGQEEEDARNFAHYEVIQNIEATDDAWCHTSLASEFSGFSSRYFRGKQHGSEEDTYDTKISDLANHGNSDATKITKTNLMKLSTVKMIERKCF